VDSGAIPVDSGVIPVDSGAIPVDSSGFRWNGSIPAGISGARRSTGAWAYILQGLK